MVFFKLESHLLLLMLMFVTMRLKYLSISIKQLVFANSFKCTISTLTDECCCCCLFRHSKHIELKKWIVSLSVVDMFFYTFLHTYNTFLSFKLIFFLENVIALDSFVFWTVKCKYTVMLSSSSVFHISVFSSFFVARCSIWFRITLFQ